MSRQQPSPKTEIRLRAVISTTGQSNSAENNEE
jgi:hypothetical protein